MYLCLVPNIKGYDWNRLQSQKSHVRKTKKRPWRVLKNAFPEFFCVTLIIKFNDLKKVPLP